MNFLNVIKRGPQTPTKSLKEAIAPEVAAPPTATAEPAQKGFQLPELDPNDPDFAEKKRVHDSILALDKHFLENVPNVDFMKHYQGIIDEQKKAPGRRELHPLSKFAIALGTQGEDPSAPNVGLASVRKTEDERLGREQDSFEKVLGLKKAALEGHINQLMSQGKFRQALSQLALSQDMAIDEERRKHGFRMKEEEAKIGGRRAVAEINAKSAKERAEIRAKHATSVGANLKLAPADRAEMAARIESAKRKFNLATARDPVTLEGPSTEQIDSADDIYRIELRDIHDEYEDREIGNRPPPAGPAATPKNTRPSGAAWKAAAGG